MRYWMIFLVLLFAGCGDSDVAIREKADKAYASKDYVTALPLYTKLANKGDAKAQIMMGVFFSAGWGVPKDRVEGRNWYIKAAEQGNVNALNNLANGYKYGWEGVPPDYSEALKWYEKCAAQSACLWEYGDMFETGLGVPENQAEALRLYKLGAEKAVNNQGDLDQQVQSQIHLARMYANGWGVPEDCAEATRLMALAASSHSIYSGLAKRKLDESACPGHSATHQWQ